MATPQSLLDRLPHSATSTPAHILQTSIRESFPRRTPPPNYTKITSLSHLQRTIISAREKKLRIKATSNPASLPRHAALHATQIIATTSLTAITRNGNTVTAQAGVMLSELPLPLVPPRKSVGAAIANMLLAHGGFSEARVSAALVAVSIVDSRGRLRVYAKGDYARMFDAVLHSYGMAGVIYDATFIAHYTERVVRVERTLAPIGVVSVEGLRRVADGSTAAEITWVPFNSSADSWESHNDQVVVKTVTSTMLELTPLQKAVYTTIPEYLTRNLYKLSAGGYSNFEAWHTRHILSHAFDVSDAVYVTTLREAVKEEYECVGTVEESVLFPLCLVRLSDWARVVSAWEHVVDSVRRDMEAGLYGLNVLMRLRFVGGEQDCGCVLTIVSGVGTLGWDEFASRVVQELVEMGGRWVVNREGVKGIDVDVDDVRLWVRNAGLDDCGMFEDDVVGFDDVKIVERFDGMSDVTDEEVYVGVVMTEGHELWWVWAYLAVYGVSWCCLFGRDALESLTNFLKSPN